MVRKAPGAYEVVDLELDDPRPGEVQVVVVAAGLCRCADHVSTGDHVAAVYPLAGGHEGAGIVTAVGVGTTGFAEGDHVVLTVPGCGRCRWCLAGQQNLCDLAVRARAGGRLDEPGSYRLSLDGAPVGQMGGISAFCATTTVSALSAIRIPDDVPLDLAALLGCGAVTGWGAATVSAETTAGDTVVVAGVGGVGACAVQGARFAGAAHVVAAEPLTRRRESALRLGATHAVATMEEAAEIARELTGGRGADAAVVAVGVTTGADVAAALDAVRRGGTVVVVGLGDDHVVGAPLALSGFALDQKRVQGSASGGVSPAFGVPRLVELWRSGDLELEDLVTARYSLDEIAQGYEDLVAGRHLRGIVLGDDRTPRASA